MEMGLQPKDDLGSTKTESAPTPSNAERAAAIRQRTAAALAPTLWDALSDQERSFLAHWWEMKPPE